MSKGSRRRPSSVDAATVESNWNNIFKKDSTMQVRVNEEIGGCGCGRSPTGKCVGWHSLNEEEFQDRKEKYATGKVDLYGVDIK